MTYLRGEKWAVKICLNTAQHHQITQLYDDFAARATWMLRTLYQLDFQSE